MEKKKSIFRDSIMREDYFNVIYCSALFDAVSRLGCLKLCGFHVIKQILIMKPLDNVKGDRCKNMITDVLRENNKSNQRSCMSHDIINRLTGK